MNKSPTMQSVSCPGCGKTLHYSIAKQGLRARCLECRTIFKLPVLNPAPREKEEAEVSDFDSGPDARFDRQTGTEALFWRESATSPQPNPKTTPDPDVHADREEERFPSAFITNPSPRQPPPTSADSGDDPPSVPFSMRPAVEASRRSGRPEASERKGINSGSSVVIFRLQLPWTDVFMLTLKFWISTIAISLALSVMALVVFAMFIVGSFLILGRAIDWN